MGVPCMTLRGQHGNVRGPSTEGTNELIGTDPKAISPGHEKIVLRELKTGRHTPLMGDGKSSREKG